MYLEGVLGLAHMIRETAVCKAEVLESEVFSFLSGPEQKFLR